MRQIVIRTLRQAGYDDHDIVEAEDGRDALDKVSSESPDLVLSDWNMPNMTGIECLQALRSMDLRDTLRRQGRQYADDEYGNVDRFLHRVRDAIADSSRA